MSTKSILLSSAGLRNMFINDDEFTFILGETEIRMNRVFAQFISPKVAQIHHSDPTINSFEIDYIEDIEAQNKEDIFSKDIIMLFKNISQGSQISITEEQSIKLRILSIILCNEELLKIIDDLYPIEFNLKNVDFYLKNLKILFDISERYGQIELTNLIEPISKNFDKIDKNLLKKMPKPILFSIISNEQFNISSEDSLFDFITDLFDEVDEKSPTFVTFLEQVKIEKLSFEKFLLLLKEIRLSDMTEILWSNLCTRFSSLNENVKPKSHEQPEDESCTNILYDGNNSQQFNGIIRKMSQECGGNVSDKNVVLITSLNVHSGGFEAKNVADLERDNIYLSKNVENNWIKYDFREKKVHPTHYSIKSHTGSAAPNHLKNWVVEGSNDDSNWTPLDTRNDNTSLNNYMAINTFKIDDSNHQNKFYRFLRLRQTGPNNSNRKFMGICALEYFGKIK